MKTIKIAGIALAVPISAALVILIGAFIPKTDTWGMGNLFLAIVIGIPLIVVAPFSSLIGLCCSIYALGKSENKATPRILLALNGILFIPGAIMAVEILNGISS